MLLLLLLLLFLIARACAFVKTSGVLWKIFSHFLSLESPIHARALTGDRARARGAEKRADAPIHLIKRSQELKAGKYALFTYSLSLFSSRKKRKNWENWGKRKRKRKRENRKASRIANPEANKGWVRV